MQIPNRDRDYINKRPLRYLRSSAQYAAIGVPEYWLIDPKAKTVTVLELEGDDYREVGTFQGIDPIVSPTFPALTLSTEQVFLFSLSLYPKRGGNKPLHLPSTKHSTLP